MATLSMPGTAAECLPANAGLGEAPTAQANACATPSQAAADACVQAERTECATARAELEPEAVRRCREALGATLGAPLALLAGVTDCAAALPSGTLAALAPAALACLQNPGACEPSTDVPEGAVIMLDYHGCDSCFTWTVAPGWSCVDSFVTYAAAQIMCRPSFGNSFKCANFHTDGLIPDGNPGTSITATTECGVHKATCQATVGVNAGACTHNVLTPVLDPPLFCMLEVHHPTSAFIRHAAAVCFNDP